MAFDPGAQNIQQSESSNTQIQTAQLQKNMFDPNYKTPLTGYTDSEDAYFDSLLKKISWAYDSIFTEADKNQLLEDVEFTDEDINGITTKGLNKGSAPNNQTSMWRELSASQTGTEKKIVHYFEQVYKKLACCMGKEQLTVNIPRYNRSTKKMETIERTIVIDRGTCKINGIDYEDDNFSEKGYKPACEKFMKRFIAFLLKYEPTNPMIKKYGGCLANKFLSEGVKSNPKLYNIINNNRSCTVNECSASAYKRLGDRKNCETVFCEAITNISDIDAGRDVSLETSISQNCGASAAAEYASKTENKQETEEDKTTKEIEETIKKTEEIAKNTEEAKKELEVAEKKLEEATTTEEKEEAEKEIAVAEQKLKNTGIVDEGDITVADEQGFIFTFINNIVNFFSNLFYKESFTNLNNDYFYLLPLLAIPFIYLYKKTIVKNVKKIIKIML